MHINVEMDCVQIESNYPGEDRFCARRTEKVQAFGVMDGHGGYLAADIASALTESLNRTFESCLMSVLNLLDTIIESLVSATDPPSDNDIVTIINEAFQAVDALILKEAQSLLRVFNAGRSKPKKRAGKTPSLAGSCAVVVIITNGSVFVAHVGDCRAVMISDQTELDVPNTDTNDIASGLPNTNDSATTPLRRKKDRLSLTKRKRSSRSSSRSKEVEREQVRVDLLSPSSERPGSSQSTSSPSIQLSPSPDGVLPFSDTKCNNDDLYTIDLHIQELYAQTLSRSSSLSSNGRGGSDDGDDEVKTELLQSESSRCPIQGYSEAEDAILMSTRQAVILGLDCDVGVDQQLAAVWREGGSGIGMTLGGSLCADLLSYALGPHRLRSLTNDHACTAAGERWAMRLLTHDAHAIRPSGSDRSSTSSAPDRVAGSLAITRALGDGYLKIRELSFAPYKEYVPYITCKPTITYKKLTPSDKKIVLASDGLWNYMSEEEVLAIAAGYVDTTAPCSNADQSQSPLPPPPKPFATKCLDCRQRELHAVSRDFDVADPEHKQTAEAAPAEDEVALHHAHAAFKADFAVCGCLDSPCNPLCGSLWMLNSHVPKNTTTTSDTTSGSHHLCHTGYRHVVDGGLIPAAALLRENEKNCIGYRSARSQLRWVCHDCGTEICDEHDNIQPQIRPLRLPNVVALRSMTLRSDVDVSSPPLGRLMAGSSVSFDKIVRVAAIPGSTEAVYRLRVLVEGHQLTKASPHNALVGWVSLYGRSNDHQVVLLELVPGTAARAAQAAIHASELHSLHAHAHIEGEDEGAIADGGHVVLWEAGHTPPLPLERQSPSPSLSPFWSEAEISEEKKMPDSKALARVLRGGKWSRRRRSSSFGSFDSGAIPTPLRKSLRLTPVHGQPSARYERSALLPLATDHTADGRALTSGHAKAGSAQRMESQAISVGSDDEEKVRMGRSRRRTRYRSDGDMGRVGGSGEFRDVEGSRGSGVETERGLADHLLDECIDNAARNARMSSSALRALDRGHRRRCILDDITVMVLDLQTQ